MTTPDQSHVTSPQLIWRPDPTWIEHANVTRLMRCLGYAIDPRDPVAVAHTARAFVARSGQEVAWFWDAALRDMGMHWDVPYSKLLDTSGGHAWTDWFIGGRCNIVSNCLDRHARSELASKPAVIAEREDGSVQHWTFETLHREVSKLANAMVALGIEHGDRVACYMPMVGEVVVAMLATQKLGAIFVPIFSGYAPKAVAERLHESEAKLVFTTDGAVRRGKTFALKAELDKALEEAASVRHVIVLERARSVGCPMTSGRDHDWSDICAGRSEDCPTVSMPALAPALILFTSGTTGKPKGTVHTHAGCLPQMGKELLYNFDLKSSDTFFWLTDIGWMMGAWEIIGCLMHGATIVLFEGAPDYPTHERLWETVERHQVTTLGISPTAVRMLMRAGDESVARHPMNTLRILGSTGEPWDPESYLWFFEKVGKKRCPIINISGGTDIVGCFLAPLPILPLTATTLQCAGLGMDVDVFNEAGESVRGEVGYSFASNQPRP